MALRRRCVRNLPAMPSSLDTLSDDFPSDSREHAIVVAEVAKPALLAEAVAA
jgi:hypothetical protein